MISLRWEIGSYRKSLFPPPHDTLTAYFGEEFVVSHLSVEQSGEDISLAYEWSYGTLNTDEDGWRPIRLKIRYISCRTIRN